MSEIEAVLKHIMALEQKMVEISTSVGILPQLREDLIKLMREIYGGGNTPSLQVRIDRVEQSLMGIGKGKAWCGGLWQKVLAGVLITILSAVLSTVAALCALVVKGGKLC